MSDNNKHEEEDILEQQADTQAKPQSTESQPSQYGQAPPYPPYGAPQQPYGTPQQPYGAPQQPYGAPQQPYGAPQQPYGAPQQPYGAPPQPYGAPQTPYYGPGPYSNYGMPPETDILLMEYPGEEKRLVKLASRGARFGAYIIDYILSSIPSSILTIIFFAQFFPSFIAYANAIDANGQFNPGPEGFEIDGYAITSEFMARFFVWILLIIVISLVVQVLYYGLIPVLTKGQTPGKKMLHLRAVSESGHYLSTGGQLLRGLVGYTLLSLFTSGLTVLVSGIMILISDKRQGIHDYIAASLVISEKPF